MQDNNKAKNAAFEESHWKPTATLSALQARATLYRNLRAFFAERNVLEVETPLLCQYGTTDLYIDSFAVPSDTKGSTRYLQTSPEFAMKRLLAAGVGSIFQITKAFRLEEAGNQHNPEFTMIEWYRVGFTHLDLIQEMIDLLLTIAPHVPKPHVMTYAELFTQKLQINPHTISLGELQALTKQHIALQLPISEVDKTTCLQLLMSHIIEPQLPKETPVFITDFPAEQAALARLRKENNDIVAERFELYWQGMELANGFHELQNAEEQAGRFQKDSNHRLQQGKSPMQGDPRLIAALHAGLPACAGVALGIDRLLMALTQSSQIKEVLSFPWAEA